MRCQPTDLIDRQAAERMVRQTLEAFGRVDLLVNNVGWATVRPFSKKPPELWQKVIDLNLMTTLNCARAALDPMMAQQKNPAKDGGKHPEYSSTESSAQ